MIKLNMCVEVVSIGNLILGFNKLEQIFVAGVSHLNLYYSYTEVYVREDCPLTETANIKLQEWSYEYGYKVLPIMCCLHTCHSIYIIVFIAAILYIIHTIHLHMQLMH